METRQRILQATVHMLEQQGGRGVRMGDIAKAAEVSRQAVYLHFASRAELLVAASRYKDEQLNVEQRLAPSRAAGSGAERLVLYIEFWGSYIPQVYGMAKALLLVLDTDEAAATAWNDRMAAMRDGCRAVIETLHAEGRLAPAWSVDSAIDAFWTQLLVPNWENLTQQCGWSHEDYIRRMIQWAELAFIEQG